MKDNDGAEIDGVRFRTGSWVPVDGVGTVEMPMFVDNEASFSILNGYL